MSIEGVEIDARIIDLARKFFRLPEAVAVSITDGRAYLRTSGQYDVILVDAYKDITIPFHMSTVEYFGMVRDHLKEGGVMVVNLNMHSEQPDSLTFIR
jgi:spermidine synthase